MPLWNVDHKVTFKLPSHSSLVELAHSSSLESPLKNDVYQYFSTPKSQLFGRITTQEQWLQNYTFNPLGQTVSLKCQQVYYIPFTITAVVLDF